MDVLLAAAYTAVGHNIRSARIAAHITQEDLAHRVGLSRASINNIEHGRQKVFVHTLLDLAAACGVDAGKLLPRESLPEDVASWVSSVKGE